MSESVPHRRLRQPLVSLQLPLRFARPCPTIRLHDIIRRMVDVRRRPPPVQPPQQQQVRRQDAAAQLAEPGPAFQRSTQPRSRAVVPSADGDVVVNAHCALRHPPPVVVAGNLWGSIVQRSVQLTVKSAPASEHLYIEMQEVSSVASGITGSKVGAAASAQSSAWCVLQVQPR